MNDPVAALKPLADVWQSWRQSLWFGISILRQPIHTYEDREIFQVRGVRTDKPG